MSCPKLGLWFYVGYKVQLVIECFIFVFYICYFTHFCSSVYLVRHKASRQRYAMKKMRKHHLMHKNQVQYEADFSSALGNEVKWIG